jgi:Fe-S-cluster containining protein
LVLIGLVDVLRGQLACPEKTEMIKTLKTPEICNDLKDAPVLCFRCGVCCRKYQVRLDIVEARRIADELGVFWDEFRDRYLDDRWPGAESFLLSHDTKGCIFLEQEKGSCISSCSIHPVRSSSCRDWSPDWDKTECQEGLSAYWGLTVDSEGKLKGAKKRIQRFRTFQQGFEITGTAA